MERLSGWRERARDALKGLPLVRPLRRANLELRNRAKLPKWRSVVRKQKDRGRAALSPAYGPKVLVATNIGTHLVANTLDSTLAVALALRGARVHALLCDGALPACFACEVNWWPDHEHFLRHGPSKTLCGPCFRPARRMWAELDLPLHLIGGSLTPEDRATATRLANAIPACELDSLEYLGVRVGMQARSGVIRYFARETVEREPDSEPVRRRFLAAALMATMSLDRLFAAERFDACVAHHGIYVPQGLLVDLARKHGARLTTWNIAYRAGSFIFSHDDTYHFTLMNEPVEHWEALPWNETLETALRDYMQGRATGAKDWVSYHDANSSGIAELQQRYHVDFSKPIISAFTNVAWDAQVYYPSNAFSGMYDWIVETVRYFSGRPDLELIVRVHPAEVRNPMKSRDSVVTELARAFPELPPNVHVIPPDVPINSYAVAAQSNAAIIYGTKMGVELAYRGIPTVVAGESWARNKGFTLDPTTRDEYFGLLDELPFARRLDAETQLRAAKYAFHFFFRRTIPLEFFTPRKGEWPPFKLELDSIEPLQPGRSLGLDVACEGILTGSPFLYPAERLLG